MSDSKILAAIKRLLTADAYRQRRGDTRERAQEQPRPHDRG